MKAKSGLFKYAMNNLNYKLKAPVKAEKLRSWGIINYARRTLHYVVSS
jgi:hypothetical protein